MGDSTAWSAGLALKDRNAAWRVNLINASRIGCGIAPGVGAGDGDQAPVKYGECWNWPQEWQQTVAVQKPDVSLLILGHWEVVNRNVNGKVMYAGQPVVRQAAEGPVREGRAGARLGGRQGRPGDGAVLPASRAC